MASLSSSPFESSSTPSKKVKWGDNSSSSSRTPTLEEEVISLRAENEGLRKENRGLRDDCEQLRTAQAESQQAQQHLFSRATWPGIEELNYGRNDVTTREHYSPSEIIVALKRGFQVPYNDDDAKALLEQKGFNPDDVHRICQDSSIAYGYFPLEWFSYEGDLMMCQWLHANGAADDISRGNEDEFDATPMHHACNNGHLSVCKWLFEMGADGDISRADDIGNTPLHKACENGHLSVCKWLFEVGADGDISRANVHAETPMWLACTEGCLPVCKWLFEVGADGDICRTAEDGITPMHCACEGGHLSVCKWLFEVGADGDISRVNDHGLTPVLMACSNDQLPVCEWLIAKGVLNDPGSPGQHITQAIMERNVPSHRRPLLLAWAQGVVAASDSFRNTVLMGTFSPPSSTPAAITALLRRALITAGNAAANAEMIVAALSEDQRAPLLQQLRPRPAFSKLSGLTDALELVADFVDVWRGRELRNAREFAGCLLSSLV